MWRNDTSGKQKQWPGCGKNKKEGFKGVDIRKFDGVDTVEVVCDLGKDRWPFDDESCEEAHCSHTLEHIPAMARIHFFNELWRVLKVGAKCSLTFPHWASNRYYGDPTHKEPFSEMAPNYLFREWRLSQAPHTDAANSPHGYSCDFDWQSGYATHPALHVRSQEAQQYAVQWYKESCTDFWLHVTKRA